MIILFVNLFLVNLFVVFSRRCFWLLPRRVHFILDSSKSFFKGLFNIGVGDKTFYSLFYSLFYFFLFTNLFSNVPLSVSPTLYYYYTFSFSFVMWVSLIVVVFSTQLSEFFAHLIPFGAPMFLSFLLPVVELFRQIIRPLTLIIRLSTNLSAGHIMLYMFSFFSLSSVFLAVAVFWLLLFLMILEVRISLLQAYIFTSLSYLYISETL